MKSWFKYSGNINGPVKVMVVCLLHERIAKATTIVPNDCGRGDYY